MRRVPFSIIAAAKTFDPEAVGNERVSSAGIAMSFSSFLRSRWRGI